MHFKNKPKYCPNQISKTKNININILWLLKKIAKIAQLSKWTAKKSNLQKQIKILMKY